MASKNSSNKSSSRSGKTYYSHHISYWSNWRPSSVTTTNKSTWQTTTKKVWSSWWWSSSWSSSRSSSSSNATYKYNPTTGYYERTDWWTDTYWYTTVGNGKVTTDYASKYANNSTYNSMVSKYWADAVHKALDYTSSWGKDSNQLKSILNWWSSNNSTAWVWTALSKMAFWSSAGNATTQATRNQQIANLLKDSWVKYDNAQSIRELLEKYSPGYAEADEKDRDATASRIFSLYSWNAEAPITNDDVIVWEWDETENEQWIVDYDELLAENWLGWEEDANEETIWDEEPEEDERDRKIRELEDELYEYKNNDYNQLESAVNDALWNKEEEKNTWLTDEQKAANAEASTFAWNRAQENNEQPVVEQAQPEQKQEGLVDTSAYEQRQTKMNNSLEKLWLNIWNTSPQTEQNLIDNAMEGWEQPAPLDEQAQIAESIQSKWEVTPEFTDENTLVNSYETAFDQILNKPDLNSDDIMNIFYSAKDAAALYAARNWLSDEAYKNIVWRIKSSPALKSLLEKYREWQNK